MSSPDIDPVTAQSEQEDADFAGEHTEPTYRDQPPTGEDVGSDEATSESGPGGMDPDHPSR
ncbi:hypothetical protein HFP15_06355 [Amycolatopsis sp. K13G38]|uniref:Uncharacterized protein n=1 Tax=Amycolatopsis acididurans TaxID=2724524 RepID=A0ABX1IYC4_9PSEU|nr:hypothetical protein [Amycolatopsis acididurans]NKQ52497.1 hypothetical protein [Amycolatopsis acididurans]